jgi:hypothetical protein
MFEWFIDQFAYRIRGWVVLMITIILFSIPVAYIIRLWIEERKREIRKENWYLQNKVKRK